MLMYLCVPFETNNPKTYLSYEENESIIRFA